MTENNNEFRDWMDRNGIKIAEAATALGVGEQTVANWRSIGVPPRRAEHVRFYMANWEQTAGHGENTNSIVVRATPDQFKQWNKAAMLDGMLIEDWARQGLDELAAEAEAGEFNESPPAIAPYESTEDWQGKQARLRAADG